MPTARLLAPALVLWLAGLVGCASRLDSGGYFDHQIDFARFETFGFAPEPLSAPDPSGTMQRDRRITRAVILEELAAKGMTRVETDPDLVVVYHVGTRSKVRVSGRSTEGEAGILVIHFRDPAIDQIVWQGWAEESFYASSMDPATEIRKAVSLILSGFPPPSPTASPSG